MLDSPLFSARVAQVEIDLMALELLVLQALTNSDPGRVNGPEASILKIQGTDIQQRLTELMVDAVGPYAMPLDEAYLDGSSANSVFGDDVAAPLARQYLSYRKPAVYGGSTEIQKNIVSKMILGI